MDGQEQALDVSEKAKEATSDTDDEDDDDDFDDAFAAALLSTKSPGHAVVGTACGISSCRLCGESSTCPQSQRELVAALVLDRPVLAVLEPIHGRWLCDGVASHDECRWAADACQRAILDAAKTDADGHSDGEGRLFSPDAPSAAASLGADGLALIVELRARAEARVTEHFGAVSCVGCLLSWISAGGAESARTEPPRSFDPLRDAHSGTFAPHVDAANQPAYEISSLLYLSTAHEDFEGGLFAFNDADADRVVEPAAGRLLCFCSGYRNLHQVKRVTAGERFVLSMWYRRR